VIALLAACQGRDVVVELWGDAQEGKRTVFQTQAEVDLLVFLKEGKLAIVALPIEPTLQTLLYCRSGSQVQRESTLTHRYTHACVEPSRFL